MNSSFYLIVILFVTYVITGEPPKTDDRKSSSTKWTWRPSVPNLSLEQAKSAMTSATQYAKSTATGASEYAKSRAAGASGYIQEKASTVSDNVKSAVKRTSVYVQSAASTASVYLQSTANFISKSVWDKWNVIKTEATSLSETTKERFEYIGHMLEGMNKSYSAIKDDKRFQDAMPLLIKAAVFIIKKNPQAAAVVTVYDASRALIKYLNDSEKAAENKENDEFNTKMKLVESGINALKTALGEKEKPKQ